MATLATVADLVQAWYRLVGTVSSDAALTENAESADEVAYLCLTHGAWQAQRYLCDRGLSDRWFVRSAALSWSGTDAADGGRYTSLPSDFLMLYGDEDRSSLVDEDFDPWGREIDAEQAHRHGAGYFYLRNERLWLTIGSDPPTTLYLEYVGRHAEITAVASLDFPTDARALIVAYAAEHGMHESWLPGGVELEAKILGAVRHAETVAAGVARRSRKPRKRQAPKTIGTRYFA